MATAKIQKGDSIKVIAGAYKGTAGQVSKVIHKKNAKGKLTSTRISVTTLPKIAKFRKANAAYQVPGMQSEVNRTIDISNVMLVTKDGSVSRSSIQTNDGKKVRILKKDSSAVVRQAVTETKTSNEDSNKSELKALPNESHISNPSFPSKESSAKKASAAKSKTTVKLSKISEK